LILNSGLVPGRFVEFNVSGTAGFFGAGVSYRIVECSSERRSKARREPSALTETKISVLPGCQSTS
jgi:hypothetical protein